MIQYLHSLAKPVHRIIGEHDAATAYIFSLDFSSILMVKKRFSGRLMPPGGHVDEGESYYEAVLREIHEESNINTSLLKKVQLFQIPQRVPGEFEVMPAKSDEEFVVKEVITPIHFHLDHIYCFQYPEKFKRRQINNTEIKEVLWVDVNTIQKKDLYPNVYRTIMHFYSKGITNYGLQGKTVD